MAKQMTIDDKVEIREKVQSIGQALINSLFLGTSAYIVTKGCYDFVTEDPKKGALEIGLGLLLGYNTFNEFYRNNK